MFSEVNDLDLTTECQKWVIYGRDVIISSSTRPTTSVITPIPSHSDEAIHQVAINTIRADVITTSYG